MRVVYSVRALFINSNGKLAIPAKEPLAEKAKGITRFIRSVKDIELHLRISPYSGN